jgi:hypothetical protein
MLVAPRTLRPQIARAHSRVRGRFGRHRARRSAFAFLLACLVGGAAAAAVLITGSGASTVDRAYADFSYHGQLGTQRMTAGRVLGPHHAPLGGLVITRTNGSRTRYWYCISYEKRFPGTAVRYGVPVPFHGTAASRRRADIGLVSMVIQRYGMRSGTGGRDAVDIHAAEVSAVVSHVFDEVNRNGQWQYLGLGGTSKSNARRLVAAAKRYAGPYRISIAATKPVLAGSTHQQTLTVRNAYGAVGAGVAVHLSATNATLAHRTLVTNSRGQVAVKYTASSSASATRVGLFASASVNDTMRLLRSATTALPREVQDFVSAGTGRSTYRGRGTAVITHLGAPTMSTRTSAPRVIAGSALTDTIVVKNTAGRTGTIVATLYGPAAGATGPWTTVAAHVSVAVHGDGTYVTPPIVVAKAGVYSWGEAFTLTGGAAPVATTTPGEVEETTVVTQPMMTTQTSTQHAVVGSRITDAITVTGTAGTCGDITATLYGPAASTAGPWTTTAGAVHLHVCGDGTFTTPAVTVTKAGVYSWGEAFTLTGGSTPVATTNAGEVSETTVVSTPEMVTQTSSQSAEVGAKITDEIDVSGTSGACGRIVATLYGPAETTSGSWTSVAGRVSVDICGDGKYRTPAVEIRAPGLYSWGESLVMSGQSLPVSTTKPGQLMETTLVGLAVEAASAKRIDTGGALPAHTGPSLDRIAGWGAAGIALLLVAVGCIRHLGRR